MAEFRIGLGAAAGAAFVFAVSLIGGLWTISEFVLDPMNDEISELRRERLASVEKTHTIEMSLRNDFAILTTELRVTNERLAGLVNSVSGLDETVRRANDTIVQSVSRQEDFERWVALRLGPQDGTAVLVPGAWQDGQEAVFKTIASGGESPLTGWYEALSQSKK